ncbi:MAG: hypothetical protein U0263_22835 [Polyangiaceae bacterium]
MTLALLLGASTAFGDSRATAFVSASSDDDTLTVASRSSRSGKS